MTGTASTATVVTASTATTAQTLALLSQETSVPFWLIALVGLVMGLLLAIKGARK